MAPCSLYSSSVYGYGGRWCSSWKRRWGGIGSRAVGMWKKTGSLPPSVWEAHHPDVPTHALGPDRRLPMLYTCTWAMHVTNTYTKKETWRTQEQQHDETFSMPLAHTKLLLFPWVSFSVLFLILFTFLKWDTEQLNILKSCSLSALCTWR